MNNIPDEIEVKYNQLVDLLGVKFLCSVSITKRFGFWISNQFKFGIFAHGKAIRVLSLGFLHFSYLKDDKNE